MRAMVRQKTHPDLNSKEVRVMHGVSEHLVREVFIVHVGCTRCVTFSTANNMKIRARITLNVEFIRTRIFLFLFDV